jgi:hypothetical protein
MYFSFFSTESSPKISKSIVCINQYQRSIKWLDKGISHKMFFQVRLYTPPGESTSADLHNDSGIKVPIQERKKAG